MSDSLRSLRGNERCERFLDKKEQFARKSNERIPSPANLCLSAFVYRTKSKNFDKIVHIGRRVKIMTKIVHIRRRGNILTKIVHIGRRVKLLTKIVHIGRRVQILTTIVHIGRRVQIVHMYSV